MGSFATLEALACWSAGSIQRPKCVLWSQTGCFQDLTQDNYPMWLLRSIFEVATSAHVFSRLEVSGSLLGSAEVFKIDVIGRPRARGPVDMSDQSRCSGSAGLLVPTSRDLCSYLETCI